MKGDPVPSPIPESSLAVALRESKRLLEQIAGETRRLFESTARDGLLEPLPSRDGACEIRIAVDGLSVVADFIAESGQGRAITEASFFSSLGKLAISYGLLPSAHGPYVGKQVVVALGSLPVDAFDEHWEVVESIVRERQVLDNTSTLSDFKTRTPFVQVHRGDLVVRRVPARSGQDGRTVTGISIPFATRVIEDPSPGKNLLWGPEGLVAACDGSFCSDAMRFWIDQVLTLESGVGYDTGHIDFDGDVRIHGEVAAGFRVHARGSVYASQTLDVSEVVCNGEITTPAGIIGRKGSTLRAGGRVRAKFLENCDLWTSGSIEIEASVLRCHVRTLGTLTMGPQGVVVGGRIEAQNGIDVFQVGNAQGVVTEVVCGMDFAIVEKMEWARIQSLSLVRQLQTLESHRLKHPGDERALAQACAKVRQQVLRLNELSRSLAAAIDQNDSAVIWIRGEVHAGTRIEICHVVHHVRKTQSRMKYSLDKETGTIREEHR